MARPVPIAVVALLLAAGSVASSAETLLLDEIEMAAPTAASRPHRGMTMDAVQAKFGEPTTRHPAVGEPPITRWDYPAFSVYFEHQYVIHAVAAHSGQVAQPAQPAR